MLFIRRTSTKIHVLAVDINFPSLEVSYTLVRSQQACEKIERRGDSELDDKLTTITLTLKDVVEVRWFNTRLSVKRLGNVSEICGWRPVSLNVRHFCLHCVMSLIETVFAKEERAEGRAASLLT
jgi:hypothetical protein